MANLTKKQITKIARERIATMLDNAMQVEYENNVGIEGDWVRTGDPDFTREQNEAIHQRLADIVGKFDEANFKAIEKLEDVKLPPMTRMIGDGNIVKS
jgi:hypothetical protein